VDERPLCSAHDDRTDRVPHASYGVYMVSQRQQLSAGI